MKNSGFTLEQYAKKQGEKLKHVGKRSVPTASRHCKYTDSIPSPRRGEGRISKQGTSFRNSGEGNYQKVRSLKDERVGYIQKFVRSTVTNLVTYCPSALVSCKTSTPHPSPLPHGGQSDGAREHLAAWLPSCLAAFTLAEVLITLGIIGVVAAITMPVVINNNIKKSNIIRFKKIYSELQQSLRLAELEYGDYSTWDFGGYTDYLDTTKYFFENYLKLQVIKKCYPSSEECWADTLASDGKSTGYKAVPPYGSMASVITSGGYAIYSQIGTGIHNILIDVNAKKGPNQLGKDVFVLWVSQSSTKKMGIWHNEFTTENLQSLCNKSCQTTGSNYCGSTCGALVERNSWIPPKEYVW